MPHTLCNFSMTNRNWTLVGTYGTTVTGQANPGFGAVYATADGYLYGSEGYSGQIWKFSVQLPLTATLVSQGPTASSNDGARCIVSAVEYNND